MKLHLLHGPGKTGSRKKLIEIKQQFDPSNVVVFEEGSSSKDIADNLVATSLFTDERLVVLENPDENFVLDSSLHTSHLSLILWFDHELSDKNLTLKWVKEKGEVLFFPAGKEISVFPFLDQLADGDSKAFLELDKLKKGGFDIFYLITMTFYLLRNLVVTPKTAPPFVRNKLQRQRERFDKEKITKLYREILEIDFKLKSGLLETSQAEFLLVNLFTHQI